ncbi:hypothetical protein ACFFOS_05335 [Nocardioides kongjuensis]|uniref:Uncharacterized protein n=1 Tax=Nocardioides kongjuensis TaxID=349522 RepID=A0A852RAW9_9ACTN|nr:hypothetical protein [Nocardioides kongjuensis]NYD28475.1 hypothetical protein [Nocardioides kongjuensis]
MRFTEHELTAALAGAAKVVLAADRRLRKRGVDVDTAWEQMDRYQRFKVLDALGDQVLPVLVALPDVDVAPGTRPTYDDRQVAEVVEGLAGSGRGRLRRAVEVKARTALVQAALAAIPPRLDPDALLTDDDL